MVVKPTASLKVNNAMSSYVGAGGASQIGSTLPPISSNPNGSLGIGALVNFLLPLILILMDIINYRI